MFVTVAGQGRYSTHTGFTIARTRRRGGQNQVAINRLETLGHGGSGKPFAGVTPVDGGHALMQMRRVDQSFNGIGHGLRIKFFLQWSVG